MSDSVKLAAPSPSGAQLKQLATWRAWFYREAAARYRIAMVASPTLTPPPSTVGIGLSSTGRRQSTMNLK